MSQLTTNTATIDELITMATNLPDVGSGGEDVSAETAEYTELLTDLEAAVDALPDAGSGGVEAPIDCNITVTFSWTQMGTAPRYTPVVLKIMHRSADGSVSTKSYATQSSQTALPDTVYVGTIKSGDIVILDETSTVLTISGGITKLATLGTISMFSVTADGSITLSMN